MANRDNCRYIAFLYENDRTHFDKPGCLKWHGSWPNKWDCPEDCKDYEEMKMSFDLEVARRIVKEMRATDWLKYEDEFEMLTWFPDALTEIETLRIQLDAAHRLIKEQDSIIKKFEYSIGD